MYTNKSAQVRLSCARVAQQSEAVKIDTDFIEKYADQLIQEFNSNALRIENYQEYSCHLSEAENNENIVNYVFVLDSLNFCFWPKANLEYDNLAASIKKISQTQPQLLTPQSLAQINEQQVKEALLEGQDFPQLAERTRILNQLGQVTVAYFDGSFYNIIVQAQKSAVKLLFLLTSYFNEFQDTSLYRGEQICFYKRGQILIGDLYSSLRAKDELANFNDIEELTMFPDYRVPQVLKQEGILKYSQELEQLILSQKIIPSGNELEIEIRANTVHAVELLKAALATRGKVLMSIQIDWLLWQIGERKKENIFPHHRTLTIFY